MSKTKTKTNTQTQTKTKNKTNTKTTTKNKTKTKTKTKTQTKIQTKTKNNSEPKSKYNIKIPIGVKKSLQTRISSKQLKQNSFPSANIANELNNSSSSSNKLNNELNNEVNNEVISIRFKSGKFHSQSKTAYHIKREPLIKDKVLEFIDDKGNLLLKNKILKGNILDKEIFNHSELNCICENIFKKHIEEGCKCSNMKTYSSQGKSGASIHSIMCEVENTQVKSNENRGTIEKNVLKVLPLSNYYIKLREETKKYIFLELDRFTLETLINKYVNNELPMNTVKINHSGICNKTDGLAKYFGKHYGYNLMEEADLGSGRIFLNNILDRKFDKDFNIFNSDDRYKVVVNFLLQCILIIGHLHSSSLEFFHGDYKPDNVFVKRMLLNENTPKYFDFNIFGKKIKVKNMGFAVLIADFDKSSISLQGDRYKKQYRIISPIKFKPLLTSYVNAIIHKYGDIDPYKNNNDIYIEKLFISNFIPHSKDPTIVILRSAGIKLYRDFDLYTFFIKLIDTEKIRKFVIDNKIDKTIMAFMSNKFIEEIFSKSPRAISFNESVFIAIDVLNKIKEPIPRVFTDDYIKTLHLLNYRLFR